MTKLIDQIDGPADLKGSTTTSCSRWPRRSAS